MSTLLAICLVAAGFALAVPARPDRLLARRVRLGGRRSWVVGVRDLAAQGATRAKDLWVGRRGAERRRAAVREACDVVVAELRAGHSPGHALEAAGAVLPELMQVATTGRMGGDVPAALRAVQRSGEESLGRLAVAWSVAATSGAGLAGVLDRIAGGLREEEALRNEVAAQLAAPRASARVLAVLPLLGLALGTGVGADPVGFLLGSPYGWLCLVAAAVLTAAGLAWVERLARAAENSP